MLEKQALWWVWRMVEGEGRKRFFFEKKNQKTFVHLSVDALPCDR
jgi:hypothetical protein